MEYVIKGGRKISGSVTIESAKNSVLPILAACVLADGEIKLLNCPKISDVINMVKILKECGAKAEFFDRNLIINCSEITKSAFSEEIAKTVRTSVLMLGALAGKMGTAEIPYPGGCNIGGRPIDIHINALKSLGAKIKEENGYVKCLNPIKGGKTVLPFPSVGATENIILAAAISDAETIICNAAKEPEIVDLADFLNNIGAKIYGAGTSVIRIEGVKKLHGGEFTPSFDRIEAGTYLIAAAITGGEIELKGVKAENLYSLLGKLCDNTCKITVNNDIIYLHSGRIRKSFSLLTGPYPLFPTDLQAQASTLAAVSLGESTIKEGVFKKRFSHVEELRKMGADITLKRSVAKIKGVSRLHGAEVFAHDLRCGAALVLAGLNAEGVTTVKDISYLERGYYEMDKKLASVNADIKRVDSESICKT